MIVKTSGPVVSSAKVEGAFLWIRTALLESNKKKRLLDTKHSNMLDDH